MKKFTAYYYLLFILLIMGAFAAMAQNGYGLKIMGGVAFVFGILFFIEFIYEIGKKEKKEFFTLAEPVCLSVVSAIFALRIFYVYFSYVELFFAGAVLMLVLIYIRKMIIRFRYMQSRNKLLAILLFVFHLVIVFFLVSLVLVPFSPKIGEYIGIGAFVLLLGFIVAGLIKKDFLVDGENTSVLKRINSYKGHSIIIITMFTLFSLYTGLTKINVLPGIYSDEFPQVYYKLVNQAASKEEKPVEGEFKFEEFKKQYDLFIEHRNGK